MRIKSVKSAILIDRLRAERSGTSVPELRALADRYFREIAPLAPRERLGLCEELLATGDTALRLIAFRLAHKSLRELSAGDTAIPVSWIERYVSDWSECDDLCMQVVGLLFLRFPGHAMQVLDWCSSGSRWVRRSAAVALIRAARQGLQLDLILQVSRALAADGDNLVQKAHGWLLRETSRRRPDEIFQHLQENLPCLRRSLITSSSRKLSQKQQIALKTG